MGPDQPDAAEILEMKLKTLKAFRYRSLRDETIQWGDLNLFIGANASGKSTILDALRFSMMGSNNGIFERRFLRAEACCTLRGRGKKLAR